MNILKSRPSAICALLLSTAVCLVQLGCAANESSSTNSPPPPAFPTSRIVPATEVASGEAGSPQGHPGAVLDGSGVPGMLTGEFGEAAPHRAIGSMGVAGGMAEPIQSGNDSLPDARAASALNADSPATYPTAENPSQVDPRGGMVSLAKGRDFNGRGTGIGTGGYPETSSLGGSMRHSSSPKGRVPAARRTILELMPGEELWVIARGIDPAAPAQADEERPGCGALMAKLPNVEKEVPVPLKHTSVVGTIDGRVERAAGVVFRKRDIVAAGLGRGRDQRHGGAGERG